MQGNYRIENLRLFDAVDYYRFELGDFAEDNSLVRIDFDHSAGDLRLDILDSTGEVTLKTSNASWTNQDFEVVSLAGFSGGVYWIRVRSSNGDAQENYSLTLLAPTAPLATDVALLGGGLTLAPTWLPIGGTLQWSAIVANLGTSGTETVELALRVSTDLNITSSDPLLWKQPIQISSMGVSSLANHSVKLPSGLGQGTYYLGVRLDDGNQLLESDETNNSLLIPFRISNDPSPSGTIRGKAFDDKNGDGLAAGDSGRSGARLFLDRNANSRRDSNEESVVSNAQGEYQFTNLAPGRYRVLWETESNWQLASPRPLSRNTIYIHDSQRLATLDVERDEVNILGLFGASMTDIALDSAGNLFGVNSSNLYRISQVTGKATLIGAHSIPSANALSFDSQGRLFAMSSSQPNLYELDVLNARSTNLGSVGQTSSGDLLHHDGRLMLLASNDKLYEIDPTTLSVEELGPMRPGEWFGSGATESGRVVVLSGREFSQIDLGSGDTHYLGRLPASALSSIAGAAGYSGSQLPIPSGFLVEVAAGGGSLTRDFGLTRVGEISGRVFHDQDLDGTRDHTDLPVTGWTVFVDVNGDGIRQMGEPFAVSAMDGSYRLERIPTGQHRIQIVPLPGWATVAPLNGVQTLTTTSTATNGSADFAVGKPSPPKIVAMSIVPNSSIEEAVDAIELTFSNPMDPATIWPGAFVLVTDGADGVFDSGDDQRLSIGSVTWEATTKTATLQLSEAVAKEHYRFRALDVLTDIFGNQLDGEWNGQFPTGNGAEGGPFNVNFTITNGVPVGTSGQSTVKQGIASILRLSGFDPDGDVTQFSIQVPPQHGTLVPTATLGEYVYTSASNYTGPDEFTFVPSDGKSSGKPTKYRIQVAKSPANLLAQNLIWSPDASIFREASLRFGGRVRISDLEPRLHRLEAIGETVSTGLRTRISTQQICALLA